MSFFKEARDWLDYYWDRLREIHHNMRARMQERVRRIRKHSKGYEEDKSKSGME